MNGERFTWMIDGIRPPGDPDWWKEHLIAHLIVDDEPNAKVTACGRRETRHTHPFGWYGASREQIIRLVDSVHCGMDG